MFLQRECLSPFSQNGRIRKPKRREKGNKRSIYNETQKNPLFTKTNVYEETFTSHALDLRIMQKKKTEKQKHKLYACCTGADLIKVVIGYILVKRGKWVVKIVDYD